MPFHLAIRYAYFPSAIVKEPPAYSSPSRTAMAKTSLFIPDALTPDMIGVHESPSHPAISLEGRAHDS